MDNTTTAAEPENEPILNVNISRIIKGLTAIGSMDIEDFKLNYGITRNIAKLSMVEKAYNKSTDGLVKKYVKRTETGAFMSSNGFFDYESTGDREKYEEEKTKLDEMVFDEKIYKIKTSQLKELHGKGLGMMMSLCHELIIDDGKIIDF